MLVCLLTKHEWSILIVLLSRSRIMLRSPLLLLKSHWVTSISICLRSAQTLLSIYFNILCPGIRVMAHTATPPVDDHEGRQLQEATNLPPTWRQVQRITTSALIVIYAFWHGEASYEESGRACAMAILLLEFRRTRWGSTLDYAQRSIRALTGISGIWLRPFLEELLPHASEECLARVTGEQPSLSFAQHGRSLMQEPRTHGPEHLDSPPSQSTPYAFDAEPRPQDCQGQFHIDVADGRGCGTSPAGRLYNGTVTAEDTSHGMDPFSLLDFPISPFWNPEGN